MVRRLFNGVKINLSSEGEMGFHNVNLDGITYFTDMLPISSFFLTIWLIEDSGISFNNSSLVAYEFAAWRYRQRGFKYFLFPQEKLFLPKPSDCVFKNEEEAIVKNLQYGGRLVQLKTFQKPDRFDDFNMNYLTHTIMNKESRSNSLNGYVSSK